MASSILPGGLNSLFKKNPTPLPGGLNSLFQNKTQVLPNGGGSYQSPAPVVAPTNTQVPPIPTPTDTSNPEYNYTNAHVKAGLDSIYNIAKGGDVPSYIQNEYRDGPGTVDSTRRDLTGLNDSRNDIASGATDPYAFGSTSKIPYTASELAAIEKAQAGIYDPAIHDAQSRFQAATDAAKNAATAGPDLASLLAAAPDDETKNFIMRISGSQLGSTNDGKRILNLISTFPDQAKREYQELGYQKLSVAQKSDFDLNQQITAKAGSIYKALDKIGQNNPYQNFWQQKGNFLLSSGNQDYKDLGALIGDVTAAKMHALYGGALTPGEASKADKFIPNLEIDSLATIKTKMAQLDAAAKYAQDKAIANGFGDFDLPDFDTYINDAKQKALDSINGGGNPQKTNSSAPKFETLPNGKIRVYSNQQSFNPVGGDTNTLAVAVPNPQGTNRPQRNNNPFNIKASAVTSTYNGVAGIDPKAATDGGHFLAFASPQAGLEAGKKLLTSGSYAPLTVDAALRRWSNNGYGGEIAPALAGKKIKDLSKGEIDSLLNVMAHREGFYA